MPSLTGMIGLNQVFAFNRRLPVRVFTSSTTLTDVQTGTVCTNLGATSPVVFTLPQYPVSGDSFKFLCRTATNSSSSSGGFNQPLTIDPTSSNSIVINGAKQTAGKRIGFNAQGAGCELIFDGTDWVASYVTGTATVL